MQKVHQFLRNLCIICTFCTKKNSVSSIVQHIAVFHTHIPICILIQCASLKGGKIANEDDICIRQITIRVSGQQSIHVQMRVIIPAPFRKMLLKFNLQFHIETALPILFLRDNIQADAMESIVLKCFFSDNVYG